MPPGPDRGPKLLPASTTKRPGPDRGPRLPGLYERAAPTREASKMDAPQRGRQHDRPGPDR
eukprot:10974210-Alexandrium_andersonii.AAC.1